MTDPPPGAERRIETRDQWLRGINDDIDPMKHAGEGHFAVDEYFPQDIQDPHLLADIEGGGEDYYPPPKRRR